MNPKLAKERKVRAREWKTFRKKYMLTQQQLSEVLGISRRTVQYVEAAQVDAEYSTQSRFRALQAKYRAQW